MKRRLCVVAWLLLLGGCEEPEQEWRNRDPAHMTRPQYDADSYQCDRENTRTSAIVPVGGILAPLSEVDHQMAARCMAARGWYRVR